MIGRIHLKRTLKRTAGCLSVATVPFSRSARAAEACILVYHRIADVGFVDPRRDDWNVRPSTFERQVRTLAATGQIVALNDLPSLLRSGVVPSRPWICLTFDDGFANFCQHAVPILKRYHAEATFFVPTEIIGTAEPMPFDRWAGDNRSRVSDDTWRAASWDQLEKCLDSGVVSIGSHSHQHLNGSQCDPSRFAEEAGRSREILVARFGADKIRSYAYPYGSRRLGQVPEAYVNAVRDAGYTLAVTTDLGLANAATDPLTLPRIEAHQVDGPSVISAKARGAIQPYYFTDRLRKSHRA